MTNNKLNIEYGVLVNPHEYIDLRKNSKTADIVKNSKISKFVQFRENTFIYKTDSGFTFTIPLEDIKGATLLNEDKTILFMRWIRKEVELLNNNC